MMPPIFQLLAASADVTAIVGTNPARVYEDEIPQAGADPNQNIPCVVWTRVGGSPENTISERPVVGNGRYQIDCWALDKTTRRRLADAVEKALELSGYCVSYHGTEFEPDTKRYRDTRDYSFWIAH